MIRVPFAILAASLVIGHADAAPFSIQVGGPTGADGAVSFTLAGDTGSTTGDFDYGEIEQAPNFLDTLSTSFDDPKARYQISDVSEATDAFGQVTRFADFLVSDPLFSFIVTSTDFFGTGQGPQTITGYSFAFRAQISFDPTTGTTYDGLGAARMLLIPPASVLAFGPAMVEGNPFVSTVPLPTSLSLMGAGLITLAVTGCASRRRRVALNAEGGNV